MLAIRLKRVGRSGHAQFRVIVQDGRAHPKSGRVVEYLGSYNPHTKQAQLDKENIASYLKNGAQPSDRVVQLLKKEGLKLPSWVRLSSDKKRAVRNPDKRRSTRPKGAPEPEAKISEEAPATDETTDAPAEETPAAEESSPKEASPKTPEAAVPATEAKEDKPEPEAKQPAE